MKQVTINIYEYDELKPAIRERLLAQEKQFIIDTRFEVFSENAAEQLSMNYGIYGEFFYSLCYCQGDGLHFNTDNFLTEKVIKIIRERLQTAAEKAVFKTLIQDGNLQVSTKGAVNHYEYASVRDVQITCEDFDFNKLPCHVENNIKEIISTIKKEIIRLYMQICKEFEAEGYAQYDVSDDDALEELRDRTYYEDGRIYDGDY